MAGHRRLTAMQRRFAEEYIVDLNATQAALRAGYSAGCAKTHGHKVLRRPDVAALIAEAKAMRAARVGLTADRVVSELAKVAFGDPRRLFSLGAKGATLRAPKELTDAEAALISEITETTSASGAGTKRIKLHCKMAALMALAKHLGMFAGTGKLTLGQNDDNAESGQDGQDGGGGGGGGESARDALARRIAGIAERLEADAAAGASKRG